MRINAILVIIMLVLSCCVVLNSDTVYENRGVVQFISTTDPIGNYSDYRFVVKQSSVPGGAIITVGVSTISSSVAIGNFVGDSNLEVVVLENQSTLIVCDYRGLVKKLSLSPYNATSDPIMADYDADGIDEIFVESSSGVLVVDESGSISVLNINASKGSMVSADFDGDGKTEVLVENNTNVFLIENNLSVVNLYSARYTIEYLLPANLDNDVPMEVIVYETNESVVLDYPFSVWMWNLYYGSDIEPVKGNFDTDPQDEIAEYMNNIVYIFDNDGSTIMTFEGVNASVFAVGDMDGDSIDELYVWYSSNVTRLYTFGTLEQLDWFFDTIPVFYDFDGDGSEEGLAIMGTLNLFFYNNTAISLFPKDFDTASLYPEIGDLDSDGLPEFMVIQNYWGEKKLMIYKLFPKIDVVTPIGGAPSKISYNVSKYHDYSEIVNIILNLSKVYPNRTSIFYIGKSYNLSGQPDLDIIAIKITNGDNKEKPSLLVIGAHHARELITAEAALYLAVNLTEQYGYDPYITRILDMFDVYIVPVLNPGGHDYALLYNDWQRKNLRPIDDDGDGLVDEDPPEDTNGDGLIEYIWDGSKWVLEGVDNDGDGVNGEDPPGGVDLNRNYNYSWSNESYYGDPSTDVYSGSNPLSEPETQALDFLMREIMPILAFSLHSGEETVFYPWGTGYRIPVDYDLITRFAFIAQLVTGFGAMQSSSIYEAYGVWDDHAYGFYGIIPFTPEIFVKESWPKIEYVGYFRYYGIKWMFNPYPSKIREVNNKVVNMFVAVAYEATKLLLDSTPPVVKSYDIAFVSQKMFITVDAYDYDSGIHYINVTTWNSTHTISRLMIMNKTNDKWEVTIPFLGSIKIEVVNRAGLKTTIVPKIIGIQSPHNFEIVGKRVVLRWSKLVPVDIDHYEVYVNSTLVADNIPANYTEYELLLDHGYYIIKLEAVLVNGARTSDIVSIFVDDLPPIFTHVYPSNDTIITTNELIISWNANDDNGIDHYEININNTGWQNIGLSASYRLIFSIGGIYRISLKAIDLVGNSEIITVNLLVDLEPPQIEIITPENGSIINKTQILVAWKASDDLGLNTFYIRVDSGYWISLGLIYNYTLNLTEGDHEIWIKAVDIAGRESIAHVSISIVSRGKEEVGMSYYYLIILTIVTIIIIILAYLIYSRKKESK